MSPFPCLFAATVLSPFRKLGLFLFVGLLLVMSPSRAQTIPPFATGFESSEGFSLGNLHGQQGWQVSQGSASVTDALAVAPGLQSVALSPGATPVSVLRTFGLQSGVTVTYIDFFARPVVSETFLQSTSASLEGSGLGFLRINTEGHVIAFNGDGSGGGQWTVTGAVLPLNSNGQASGWTRFTVRQNYTSKKWDLYVEGTLVAADLGFKDNGASFFSLFTLTSSLSQSAYLDDLYVGDANPVSVDTDNDGMSDSWESANTLNTAVDDRDLDADSDGLSNIEEYLLGTAPADSDTDGDGMPDGWEVTYGANPLTDDASSDPGDVGRTLLQSYQQSLSPWPTPLVAAGLRAWYRADKGVVKDANDNVSQWTDVSGNGFHVVQTAQVSRQPLYVASALNGQPVVQYDDWLRALVSPRPVDVINGADDVTIIAVIKAEEPANYASGIFAWGTDGNFTLGLSGSYGASNVFSLFWRDDAGVTRWSSALHVTAGQVQVLATVKNGSLASIYQNSAWQSDASVPAGMALLPARVAVGNAAYPYYGFNGQIAEVLVYNRALSTAERESIETALMAKYIAPDSDADGLLDSWEDQQLGTRSYGPSDDPGGVGRTLLQSHQQSLSPWPAPAIANGLRAWYRADKGVVKDSNDKVSQWTDVSGNGFHVVQTAQTSRQPLHVGSAFNGQPVVQYDDFLKVLATNNLADVSGGADDATIVAVVRPHSQPHYAGTIFYWGTDGNSSLGLSAYFTSNEFEMIWRDGNGQTQRSARLNANADAVQVLSAVKDGTTASSHINGLLHGNRELPASMELLPSRLAVGNALHPYYAFHGQIAEVLVYNRALSVTERESIEAALMDKYIAPDSDADGLLDAWEDQKLGTRSYGANDDPGGVGRTLLQSHQQSLSPWPAPAIVNGLRAWYRADKGVVKDANNKVSQWTDVSGNGFHVVQTAQTNRQPLHVSSAFNNQSAVSFDGTTVVSTQAPADIRDGSDDLTLFVVAKPTVTQGDRANLVFLGGIDGGYFVDGLQSNWMQSYAMGWPGGTGPGASAAPGSVWIFSADKNSALARSFLNGELQGSATVNAVINEAIGRMAIGNGTHPYYGFNGQIAEVLVYNRALSTAERESIEAALMAKYIENANPDGDDDGDGLTNAMEATLGTDPEDADSDDDGVQDGQEVTLGMNPLVADADTLPTKISGLRLLLQANAGVTVDGSGKVSTWNDQSTYGNHATQTTAGNRPTLVADALNGQPAVRFNGSNSYLLLPHFLSGLTSAELFVVLKGSTSSGSYLFSYMGSSAQTVYPSGTNQISDGFGSTTLYSFGTGGATLASPRLYNTSAAANSWSAAIDGNVLFTSGTNTVNFANGQFNPHIGAARNGAYFGLSNWFNGDVAEIIIYDHVLSGSDRQMVAAYLTHKYSLDIETPELPTDLAAVSISPTKVSLSWMGAGSSTYTLERSTEGVLWEVVASLSGNTSYTDTGLTEATTYSYRLKASSYGGSTSYVGPVSATTQSAGATNELPLTGMKLWLKPEDLVQSSGGLSKWTDVSGMANHALQNTLGNRPQVVPAALNGQPAVRFNGSSSFLTTPHLLSGLNAAELFVVLKASTSNGSVLFSYMGSSPQTVYPSGSNQISDGFGSNTSRVIGTSGMDLAQLHLYNVSAAANSWSASLNASVVFSTTTNSVNFANGQFNPHIGAARNGAYFGLSNWFNGDVAEIIIYDRALSSLEREAVHFYLNRRYAFSSRTFTEEGGFSYDSDGDGLSNSAEQTLGTDPYRRDSDGDGLPDDWEVAFGLDPLDPTDATTDTDNDGFSNLAEYYEGTDPTVPVANDAGATVKLKVHQPATR